MGHEVVIRFYILENVMSDTWILVAESSRAKIYAGRGQRGTLVEVRDFVHPKGRLHEGDLTSDIPGSDGGSVGQGRHVLDDQVNAREQEAIIFANELANYLDAERSKRAFTALVLIAPPAFLGLLRDNLSRKVLALVSQQIDKNLVEKSVEVIHEYL